MTIKERTDFVKKNRGNTIQEMVKLVQWKDVEKALAYWYEWHMKGKKRERNAVGYRKVFNQLRRMKPQAPKIKREYLQIVIGDELWWGQNKDKDDFYQSYHIASNKYSLSFRPWAEVANMPISEATHKLLPRPDIVAHFLYEITWYGFTEEEGKEIADDLVERKKEVIKQIEEGKI